MGKWLSGRNARHVNMRTCAQIHGTHGFESGKVIGIYIPTLGQEGQRQTDPKNSNRPTPARPAKSVNSILRELVSNKQGREQQRKTTDLTLYPPHTCTQVCRHADLYA